MARRSFPSPTFDQINVTPLIDTLFFLLIIFMITAPILEYSMSVSPPKMKTSPMKPDEKAKIINIKPNGDILFEKRIVSQQMLLKRLSEIRASFLTKNTKIYLRGDKDLRYGTVIQVMRDIKNAGFEDILLVTEDEK